MTFGRNIQNTPELSLHASVFVQVCFFYKLFNLSNRTPKITQILKVTPHTACQHGTIQ